MVIDLILERNKLVQELTQIGFRQVHFDRFEEENDRVFQAPAGAMRRHWESKTVLEIVLRTQERPSWMPLQYKEIPALIIELGEEVIKVRSAIIQKGDKAWMTSDSTPVSWDEKDNLFPLISEWEKHTTAETARKISVDKILDRVSTELFGSDLTL